MSHPVLRKCCCSGGTCGCAGDVVPSNLVATLTGLTTPACLANPARFAATGSKILSGVPASGTWDVPLISSGDTGCLWRKVIGTLTYRFRTDSACLVGTGGPINSSITLDIRRSTTAIYSHAHGGAYPRLLTEWRVMIYSGSLWGFATGTPIFGVCDYLGADATYDYHEEVREEGACCDEFTVDNGFVAAGECVRGSALDATIHKDVSISYGGSLTITPEC
jgi:hypothetical protein